MIFYICQKCGYAYDERVGDIENNIEPNTPFEMLPDNWRCPLCDAKKNEFVEQ